MDPQHAPDKGIGAEGATGKVVQAMQIDLARDVVRDMKKSARQGLTLGFGQHLILRYGHTSKPLQATRSTLRQELYEQQPATDATQDGSLRFAGLVSHHVTIQKPVEKTAAEVLASEAASQKMKDQYAAIKQEKLANQATIVDSRGGPTKQRNHINGVTKPVIKHASPLFPKAKSQPQDRDFTHTLPSSKSSQPNATQDTSQASATLKAQRYTLIHFLAIRPVSFKAIRACTGISPERLDQLVDQLCEQEGTGDNSSVSLSSRRFKELDPWQFPYTSEEQRQQAIENAIDALDKQRVSPQDKLWQKLLPVNERNQGKVLSRLQSFPGNNRRLLHNLNGHSESQPASSESHKPAENNDLETMRKGLKVKKGGRPSKETTDKTTTMKKSTSKKQPQQNSKFLSSERIDDSDEDFEVAAASDAKLISPPRKVIDEKNNVKSNGLKRKSEDGVKKPGTTNDKPKSDGNVTDQKQNNGERKVKEEKGDRRGPISEGKSEVKSSNGTKRKFESEVENGPKSPPTVTSNKKLKVPAATSVKRKVEDEPQKATPTLTNGTPKASAASAGSNSFGPKRLNGKDGSAIGTPTVRPVTVKAHHTPSTPKKLVPTQVKTTSTVSISDKAVGSNHHEHKTLGKTSVAGTTRQSSTTSKPSHPNGVASGVQSLKRSHSATSSYDPTAIKDNQTAKPATNPSKRLKFDLAFIDSAPAPKPTLITRSATVNAYTRYHKLFQSYKADRRALRVQYGASSKFPPDVRKTIAVQFHRLARLQKQILAGFDGMIASLDSPSSIGTVRKDDMQDSNTLLRTAEIARDARDKCRARFAVWRERYLTMRNEGFGEMKPEEMVRLWDEFEAVGMERDMVIKNCALGFGGLEEGMMGEVELRRSI